MAQQALGPFWTLNKDRPQNGHRFWVSNSLKQHKMDALSIESMIWRFPEIGVLPNHLFLDEIFHEMNIYKPSSYWGTPMTVETIILILRIRKIPGESLRHGPWSHPHRWSRLGRSWAACHGQTGCAMVGAWLKDRQLGRMAQFWILWIRQAVFWKWCSWFLMIGFWCFLFGVGEIREVNTWAIFLLENTWYWDVLSSRFGIDYNELTSRRHCNGEGKSFRKNRDLCGSWTTSTQRCGENHGINWFLDAIRLSLVKMDQWMLP